MAASHPQLFQSPITDESDICKLVVNHFLSDRAMLQWCPAIGEDLPTPNTNETMVFSSSFNLDSDSRLVNSSVDSMITTKSN
jgi:hypothetical protein